MFLNAPASIKVILATLLYASVSLSAQGLTFKALHVGDPAPELKVTWVKGEPIPRFDPRKTYVVEFWATWCGPCKAAIPHLSELARKYQGKVDFIGVDILEDGFTDQPYDAFLPKVKAFVSEMGDKMSYSVAIDANSLYMTTYWLNASARMGIPAGFIVKEGNVIWIGGPEELEGVLEDLESGKYDMGKSARQVEESLKYDAENSPGLRAYMEKIYIASGAIAENKFDVAIGLLDENEKLFSGEFRGGIKAQKLRALIHVDLGKFMALAAELREESPEFCISIANIILGVNKRVLPETLYDYAISCLIEGDKNRASHHSSQAAVYNLVGICHFRAGHKAKAIRTQRKVIRIAKAELASGKYKGVTKAIIDGYQATLDEYRR